MTRFNLRKAKNLTKKQLRRNEVSSLMLAEKTEDILKQAFKKLVVKTSIKTEEEAKERVVIDRVDEPEINKIAQHKMFLDKEQVWEGWFTLVPRKSLSNDKSVEVATYVTWHEEWLNSVSEPTTSSPSSTDKEPIGIVQTEDLNQGILE